MMPFIQIQTKPEIHGLWLSIETFPFVTSGPALPVTVPRVYLSIAAVGV